MTLKIDKDYITQTLVELVRIDSRNPSLTEGAPGETAIAQFIVTRFQQLGLDTRIQEISDKHLNVISTLKGSGDGKSLMLNGHMDTVGVEGMVDPFSGKIVDGKLYGRGSQDMKGSLASMLGAAKALVDDGVKLKGDLIITAVADEEYASIGTEHIIKEYTADAAIVTEPTDMQLCRAHRGFIWYKVVITGRAAHGSRYDVGIDANMMMGRFLNKLEILEKELRKRPPHPLTGPPSLHASMLKGGTEVSVYAASSELHIERRTMPGEVESDITAELQAIIDQLAAEDPDFRATIEPYLERPAFETGKDAEIVGAVDVALSQSLGSPSEHIGVPFWTDAALLADAGIETVLLGPKGDGLHSIEEWVNLASVHTLAHILAGNGNRLLQPGQAVTFPNSFALVR